MIPFIALIFVALIAKLEELFFPQLLESQRRWFRNYRFQDENSVFCFICRQIPVNCPAERIGLPPMCKLNPLFNEMILMHWKASDILQQDYYIQHWS